MASLVNGNPFYGLEMLNQSLDQRQNNAMALSTMKESQRRNALLEGYAATEQARKDQEFQQKQTSRNAITSMFAPQQVGGPLMSQQGQDYQQVSLQNMQPTRENVMNTLLQAGDYEQALKYMPAEVKREDYTLSPGAMRFGPNNQMVASAPTADKSPEFDIKENANGELMYVPRQPGGQPIPVGMKGKATKERPGMSLEVNPDGTVSFTDGMAPLSKGTTAKTEQDILDTNEALQRLNQISSSFKPEYLTVPFKAGQAVNAGYEKMGGKLSPEQSKSLGEYTDFRQKGMELLNEEIKRMTGAAVTKQEEPRLRASMPDPQEDSPTEYKRKYDATVSSLKMALARKNYAMRKGVTMGNIPLNDMTKVINKRGQELESELGNRIKDKTQLQHEVQLQLSREFGI